MEELMDKLMDKLMDELMDKLMDELMDDLAMSILLFGQKKMAKTHTFDDAIAKRM